MMSRLIHSENFDEETQTHLLMYTLGVLGGWGVGGSVVRKHDQQRNNVSICPPLDLREKHGRAEQHQPGDTASTSTLLIYASTQTN